MNTLLLIVGIVFLFAGIVGGFMEKDLGMMATGIVLGITLNLWRLKRIKDAPIRKAKKVEDRRYRYYLTDEGRKALAEFLTEDELETYSWETLAHTYASEIGQNTLRERLKEQTQDTEEE